LSNLKAAGGIKSGGAGVEWEERLRKKGIITGKLKVTGFKNIPRGRGAEETSAFSRGET